MKIKLYQTEWFGEDLEQIAKDQKHNPRELANSKIYHAVYEKLISDQFRSVSQNWLDKKQALAARLLELFEFLDIKYKKILSVGCGLGVIEHSLMQHGFNIDLQECQNLSVQYLETKFPEDSKHLKFIESLDLSQIPDLSYEVVMAITSTYCLSDTVLKEFLNSLNRIIAPKGYYIWYETVLTPHDIINSFKYFLLRRKPKGVLWGWKRNTSNMIRLAEQQGFKLVKKYFLDNDNKDLPVQKLFLSGELTAQVTWQLMVFQKND